MNAMDQRLSTRSPYFATGSIFEYIRTNHLEIPQSSLGSEVYSRSDIPPLRSDILELMNVLRVAPSILGSLSIDYSNLTFKVRSDIESTESLYVEKPPVWHIRIMHANNPRDVVDALKIGKFAKVAAQLANLCKLVEDEGEAIDLRSLQRFALFVTNKQILVPDIGINPDGHIQSVWKMPDYGSLVMDFSPSGNVVFSILFYPYESGSQQQRVSGMVSEDRIMYYIREFSIMYGREPKEVANKHTESPPEWRTQIANKTTKDIIDILKTNNFPDVANQLEVLCALAEEESTAIAVQSIQKFARFATYKKISTPDIGINPDGHIQSVWKMPDYGSLVMDFSPSGNVVFSILFYPYESGSQQQRVSGMVSEDRIMHYISEFVNKVTI